MKKETVFIEGNFVRVTAEISKHGRPFLVLYSERGDRSPETRRVVFMRDDGSVGSGFLWEEFWEEFEF